MAVWAAAREESAFVFAAASLGGGRASRRLLARWREARATLAAHAARAALGSARARRRRLRAGAGALALAAETGIQYPTQIRSRGSWLLRRWQRQASASADSIAAREASRLRRLREGLFCALNGAAATTAASQRARAVCAMARARLVLFDLREACEDMRDLRAANHKSTQRAHAYGQTLRASTAYAALTLWRLRASLRASFRTPLSKASKITASRRALSAAAAAAAAAACSAPAVWLNRDPTISRWNLAPIAANQGSASSARAPAVSTLLCLNPSDGLAPLFSFWTEAPSILGSFFEVSGRQSLQASRQLSAINFVFCSHSPLLAQTSQSELASTHGASAVSQLCVGPQRPQDSAQSSSIYLSPFLYAPHLPLFYRTAGSLSSFSARAYS
mmetsp:Transcript_30052/g.70164  ORF Transcript_30052/g.70164 Transcript_30052/m.70164 type:complete len:390 (-) Transcript_30052:18-1187(-)